MQTATVRTVAMVLHDHRPDRTSGLHALLCWANLVTDAANELRGLLGSGFDIDAFISACEEGLSASKATGRREVMFSCRDIGYGAESGTVLGYWDENSTNLGGAPAFDVVVGAVQANGEHLWSGPNLRLYLFDDEVLSDEPAVS